MRMPKKPFCISLSEFLSMQIKQLTLQKWHDKIKKKPVLFEYFDRNGVFAKVVGID